jgi:hypothetical protein
MSELNGDRARFQKDRKRKLRQRQRIRELTRDFRAGQLPTPTNGSAATPRVGETTARSERSNPEK